MIDNDKKYCVYIHTNKQNGKVYIGQTCQKVESRWNEGHGYKGCTHFYNAIQKYGWDGFTHEILKDDLTLEEANEYEQFYIEEYKSLSREFGYNLQSGGKNFRISEETREKLSETRKGESNGFYGKHHTEKTREKLKTARNKRIISEETKKKTSQSTRGENNPFYGKHHTEETKEKLREINLGKHHTEETKQKISKIMKGKMLGEKSPMYGKHLSQETKEKIRQAKIGTHHTEEEKAKMSKALKGKYTGENSPHFGTHHTEQTKIKMSKCVRCVETGDVYYGTREAERKTGISSSGISRCCNKKAFVAGGYHWEYVKEENKND